MAIQDRIRKGSYKGIEFDIISIDRQKVKKNTEHQYANSVRRYIEERGVQNEDFSVTLSIFGEDDYYDKRDAMRKALDEEGEGVLVLPSEGEFKVKCTEVSDSQNIVDSLGRCDFTCTFKVVSDNEKNGNPVSIKNSKISLFNNVNSLRGLLSNAVGKNVLFSNALNYANGVTKYTNFAKDVINIANNVTSGKGSNLTSIIANFSDGLSLLIGKPVLLGSAVNAIFGRIEDVFDDAKILFSSSETLFAFGDTDIVSVSSNTPTTIGIGTGTVNRVPRTREQLENAQNNQVCNAQIQLNAVCMASNAFAQIDFDNEEELENARKKLTEQFNKIEQSEFMKNPEVDSVAEISYYIKEIRNDLADVIKEKKISTRKLVTIKPKKESVSLIAYRYYDNLDNVEGLINLNNIQNPKSIDGEMRAYTNVG